MHVPVTDDQAQLVDLVRRAKSGEDVILTHRGQPTVRLVPVDRESIRERRRRVLEQYRGAWKGLPQFEDCTAATLTDDMYDEDGLPK